MERILFFYDWFTLIKKMQCPFVIFVTGGVMSGLGKGVTTAALARTLIDRGLKIRLKKFDPYLNVDAGTLNPGEHGETFVTETGEETDLDLGHYERFTDNIDNLCVTTGAIYQSLIRQEREGAFLGKTIQIIPHVTDAIKGKILQPQDQELHGVICEIGGTVGDIEGLAYLEAARQMRFDLGPERCLFLHLSWVPYLESSKELKTKLVQHSVANLQRLGIQPDILVCRIDRELPESARKKMALFCNVLPQRVIEARDVQTIYEVPLTYHRAGLDQQVCEYFRPLLEKMTLSARVDPLILKDECFVPFAEASSPQKCLIGQESQVPLKEEGRSIFDAPDLSVWEKISSISKHPCHYISIALVTKYMECVDANKSIYEALNHAGIAHHAKVQVTPVCPEALEGLSFDQVVAQLSDYHGVLIAGGFGLRGSEGKIAAIKACREHQIPVFGVCFGMQLMVIESVRHLGEVPLASSSEFACNDYVVAAPVVAMVEEWEKEGQSFKYQGKKCLGGTMRLGTYPCLLQEGSKAYKIYQQKEIQERHRHRYEINNNYLPALKKAGLVISGCSVDGQLVEIVERPEHPWFLGVQFHPELISRPFRAHPLYHSFITAALGKKYSLPL
ncbi:MAG: hypothetical protein BGO07_03080 [Alphaproteobacteria bacterium 40-19]|nr:MAG: hypothetical protein BGO07_03080 [Alphaproteobacteria bacterium 40-19]